MKASIYLGSLLIGLGIGAALLATRDVFFPHRPERMEAAESLHRKIAHPLETVGGRIGRMVSSQSGAMDPNLPIDKAVDLLFAERKSPLRTRAFLKSRIQLMTPDQLLQSLMNGEVRTQAELDEVGRRLGAEDPDQTFDRLEAGNLRFYRVEEGNAFMDALLQSRADADASAVLARLKKMKRGGSQQDFSLRFSDYWARIDPAAAARNFSDLIYLRNMQDFGEMVFTDNSYAERIVSHWSQKDEAAMRETIAGLPPGRARDALGAALNSFHDKKR